MNVVLVSKAITRPTTGFGDRPRVQASAEQEGYRWRRHGRETPCLLEKVATRLSFRDENLRPPLQFVALQCHVKTPFLANLL